MHSFPGNGLYVIKEVRLYSAYLDSAARGTVEDTTAERIWGPSKRIVRPTLDQTGIIVGEFSAGRASHGPDGANCSRHVTAHPRPAVCPILTMTFLSLSTAALAFASKLDVITMSLPYRIACKAHFIPEMHGNNSIVSLQHQQAFASYYASAMLWKLSYIQ